MGLYVFITADIHPIGGMQIYVKSKISYLKKNGWDILVFFSGTNKKSCKYQELNTYVDGAFLELAYQPYAWPKYIREHIVNKMQRKINQKKYKEVIIESQDDVTALWGELLAEKVYAKHVCFNCNELFRGMRKCYEENLEFFAFKHERKELAGIHSKSLKNLFDGYKEITEDECYTFRAGYGEAVQDIINTRVEKIIKADWNICYFGRAEKGYVVNIINDIAKFARKYSKKEIQVIFVGDANSRLSLIEKELNSIENVEVSLLGDLVPIPAKLFEKVDVVIAGSGCAEISARQNVPTIVANAKDYWANGILGYTTNNLLFRKNDEPLMHYDVLLEQILVGEITKKIKYTPIESQDSEKNYAQHMEFIKQSASNREYFALNVDVPKLSYIEIIKFYLYKYYIRIKR